MFNPQLNLNRITNDEFTTSAPLLQNRCYVLGGLSALNLIKNEMEAKLKAKELLDKMSSQTYSYQPYAGARYSIDEIGWEAGKKCALFFVEAMIAEWSNEAGRIAKQKYWSDVKVELEAL